MFNENETVYIYDIWSDACIECRVLRPMVEENKGKGYMLECKNFVDKNGNNTGHFSGTMGRLVGEIWKTAAECYDAIASNKTELLQQYLESIRNIEDLLLWPLTHCLYGEEYTDDMAIEAYKQKSKELFGIEL